MDYEFNFKIEKTRYKDTRLRWLNSYLENRNQRVVLKDGISEAGNLRASVPQGSVLGPLLFLLYVNDIADEVLGLCSLFADGTSIGHSAHDEHALVNLTDIDLSIKVVRTMAC